MNFEDSVTPDQIEDPSTIDIQFTDGWLILTHKDNNRDLYEIELNRIDTPMKLIRWEAHLLEKVWFDQWTAREFLVTVCHHFGWRVFGHD